MKILFITSSGCDNLEDAILHGLRSIFGSDCIDYPKKDVMYKGFSACKPSEMYGNLFTIWRTLDDIPVDRTDIEPRIRSNYYDWIIFGSFFKALPFFRYYRRYLDPRKTILIDGDDVSRIALAARDFLYFKRELHPKASYYYNYKLLPPFIYRRGSFHPNVLPIAFAIPKEKITRGVTRSDKRQLFPSHIVDTELLERLTTEGRSSGHLFTEESEYYADLRSSRFGITTKRAGWDCLRHYEIAANGAVICFRDLGEKPPLSAPHGLDDSNCIAYASADELLERVEKLSDREYDQLLENSYAWIAGQTTEVRALDMLERARRKLKR
jgi:hypothetical protein